MQVEVVWNCPCTAEVRPVNTPNNTNLLRLWFHGSIVPSQLPIQLAEVMKLSQTKTSLTLAGYETIGHLGYINRFLTTARKSSDDTRIQYLGAIPSREQLYREASKCGVGIALFEKEFREPMVGASNKPFDYLACGLALLVPNTKEWLDFFVSSGCAIACDSEDEKSIEDALNWFTANPDETFAMGQRGRQLVLEKWNYEQQFGPVYQYLTDNV